MTLEWNINELKHHFNEHKLIMSDYNPLILCIQETHLKPTDMITLKGTDIYRKDFETTKNAQNGTVIITKNTTPNKEVNLTSGTSAVVITVLQPLSLTYCSIYMPPHQKINITMLEDLTSQNPEPFVLCGDFNAHSFAWNTSITTPNKNGNVLLDLMDKNSDLGLLNIPNELTYINTRSNNFSKIDLALCSANIIQYLEWTVISVDEYDSDHFPILIKLDISPEVTGTEYNQKLFYKLADWHKPG